MQIIKLKQSPVTGKVPQPFDLVPGEIALNTADGLIYARKNNGIVTSLNPIKSGGCNYDISKKYKTGDIVSLTGSNHLYIALQDNIGLPPGATTAWREFITPLYTNGTFTPTAGNEYPNILGLEFGAIWVIEGLDPSGYDMTEPPIGNSISPVNVRNDDKIIWYGKNVNNDDVWLLDTAPRVSTERGGISYNSSQSYEVGDIVSFNDNVYRCITPTTGAFNISDWISLEIPEKGGLLYDSNLAYVIGDIVSYNNTIYRCTAPTTGAFDVADWDSIEVQKKAGYFTMVVWHI